MPIFNQVVQGGGGSAPAGLYREFELDAYGTVIPNKTTTYMDFTGVKIINYPYLFASMYYQNTNISGAVDMSDLTTVSGQYACSSMFAGCTGITSADLSALTTISGLWACSSMFSGCAGLTSADMSAITDLTGSNVCSGMFNGCTSLTTVYIGGTTAIDFGTRTNQFTSMFASCTQNIDVYAPAANQAQIEAFSGYPNFGATGTVTWHWRS